VPAKHAFAYTGHLTDGKVLTPHAPAARLRAGRAWGRGVAAFHQADPENLTTTVRYAIALTELNASLDEDAAAMRSHGFYDEAEHHDMPRPARRHPLALRADHGAAQITDPEFRLELPIPSRSGRGLSNRYAFEGYLDGIADRRRALWPVEYKLRDTPQRLRAGRGHAADPPVRVGDGAAARDPGRGRHRRRAAERRPEAGPLGEGEAQGRGRRRAGVPSDAKDQLTTSASYVEACLEAGRPDINQETVAALDARKLAEAPPGAVDAPSEIEEAGRELVSRRSTSRSSTRRAASGAQPGAVAVPVLPVQADLQRPD
jgi:hypothetical protein